MAGETELLRSVERKATGAANAALDAFREIGRVASEVAGLVRDLVRTDARVEKLRSDVDALTRAVEELREHRRRSFPEVEPEDEPTLPDVESHR